jgi:hypothetical protein
MNESHSGTPTSVALAVVVVAAGDGAAVVFAGVALRFVVSSLLRNSAKEHTDAEN